MNHFVNQNILHLHLRPIIKSAYRDDGRVVSPATQKATGNMISQIARTVACTAQFKFNLRQTAAKTQFVELVEFFMQKSDCRTHIFIFSSAKVVFLYKKGTYL